MLYCFNCPKLISLPENLPESLHTLECFDCSNLSKLPKNLPRNLNILNFSYCPLLIILPENIPDNTFYAGCPWIPQNSDYYPDRIPKLLTCQRIVRNRRFRKFVKLTSSQSFNEYFFHPERKGGIWVKKQLEKQICK